MQFAEAEILELSQGIWNSVLNMELLPAETPASPHESLTAGVRIEGGWYGEVFLESSRDFAQRAAAVMFSMEPEEVTLAEMQDAIAELTNMVGGNLKSILPGPSKLSLPEFAQPYTSQPQVSGANLLSEVGFTCDAEPIRVLVYQG